MRTIIVIFLSFILMNCSGATKSFLGPKKNTSYDYKSPCASDCKNMKRLTNHADIR